MALALDGRLLIRQQINPSTKHIILIDFVGSNQILAKIDTYSGIS